MVRSTSAAVAIGSIFMAVAAIVMIFAGGMALADTGPGLGSDPGQGPEVQTPPMEFTGAFFAGGGSVYGLALFDFKELNEALPGVKFTGDFRFGEESAFLVHGGGGFGASDLRFGGRGVGGSWVVPVESERSEFDRAELKVDYGGFFFEFLLNEPPGLPIFAGLLIGGLDLELRLLREPPPDFAEAISAPFLAELKRTYFLLEPYLSTEFRVLDFMGLKLEAGYLLAFSTREWRAPLNERLDNGPLRTLFAPTFEVMFIFGG